MYEEYVDRKYVFIYQMKKLMCSEMVNLRRHLGKDVYIYIKVHDTIILVEDNIKQICN